MEWGAGETEAQGPAGRKEGKEEQGVGCWVDPQLSLKRALVLQMPSVTLGRVSIPYLRTRGEDG